jgi:molecular chaperone GrpE
VDTSETHDDLAARIAQLGAERDEAIIARQRALADFANFQRRANESEIRAFQNGAARIIRSLLSPLDNFDLALGSGDKGGTAKQLLDGVRIVRGEIAKALSEHGVTTITPQRGEEFDPLRHEAMLRQPAADLEPGTVVQVLQPGYVMGDLVLRPAKVAVAGQ